MVSKSFDLDEIKKKTAEFSKTWQKKLNYLSDSVSRSGMEGATHWLKSHHQIDELKAAIKDLLEASQEESFQLLQVETTLKSFVLPEEDLGQAEWYRTASSLISQFEKKLVEEGIFDKKLITSALKELKFISEASDFHHRYELQPIQHKVNQVYQTLQKALTDYKANEKEKLKYQAEQDKLKAKELDTKKSQAEAKKAMMENVKIKEKRLAIIEEKKRRVAEKEMLEAEQKHEMEKTELMAKQAETERQAKLQDAYVDLQLEEKIKGWSVTEILEILNNKLETATLDSELHSKLTEVIEQLQADE